MPTSVRFLSMLLIFSFMPGAAEAMENGAHLIQEGHLAHAIEHEDQHQQPDDEHGCSGMQHFCSCHMSAPFVTLESQPSVGITPVLLPAVPLVFPQRDPVTNTGVAGLFRPPR